MEGLPGAYKFGWASWPVKSRDLPVSTSQSPGFYVGARNPNSGLLAHTSTFSRVETHMSLLLSSSPCLFEISALPLSRAFVQGSIRGSFALHSEINC